MKATLLRIVVGFAASTIIAHLEWWATWLPTIVGCATKSIGMLI
jgi:hypothetical protein